VVPEFGLVQRIDRALGLDFDGVQLGEEAARGGDAANAVDTSNPFIVIENARRKTNLRRVFISETSQSPGA
jgi:hypothetical protein